MSGQEYAAVHARVSSHLLVCGAITRATAWNQPKSTANAQKYKCQQVGCDDCTFDRQCSASASTQLVAVALRILRC